MDTVTRTASLPACSGDWPNPIAVPQTRRAQETASPSGKNFMICGAYGQGARVQISLKIFIDHQLERWLKVGSGGAKWTIAPLDQWTPIPHPNASMPESSG